MNVKSKNNFLGKIIILIWVILLSLSPCGLMVEISPTKHKDAGDDQYFELRATTINNNVNGRQTINNGTMGLQYRL